MQPESDQADEIHRHHPRYRLPLAIEVDGARHQVGDWSLGGFAVAAPISGRRVGDRLPVRLIFAFDDFEMVMRFEVRLVYADAARGRFGCAFVALSRRQKAVFGYLIDAYVSGEVVSAADLLRIRAPEPDPTAADASDPPFLPELAPARPGRRPALIAAGGLLAFGLAALAGLALL
jgi:mannuronan synthase